jgi:glycosyltransferase involved in cell wall biosynthesis
MRLLVVVQPPIGGVARHVADLLPFLEPEEWDIELFCPEGSIVWAAGAEQANVTLTAISGRRAPSPSDLATTWRLVGALRRADVVHAHSSKAGFQVRALAALVGRGRRVVFTPHGWSFWAVGGWKGRVCAALERAGAWATHTIVCVAAYERDAGLREGVGRRSQYAVVPNGIELDRFMDGPAPVEGRLVMVARLAAPARRPELLVAALPGLRAKHPSAHVVFVGDGPLRGALAAQASALGVADAVTLLGDRTDVPDQLKTAAVAVHACRYDGCSLAVIEAMAAGRPVVASRVGGMDEVVLEGSTGELCSDDPEDWVATVATLLDDPLRAEAMGAAGRDRARERFARERMAQAVTDVYRCVAQPLGLMGR